MDKKFTELKPGDTIYYLVDRYKILQTNGTSISGFADSRYGLIIGSNTIDKDWFRLTNPTKKRPYVMELPIKYPIRDENDEILYPELYPAGRALPLIHITESDNSEGITKRNIGSHYNPIPCYFFSTKEKLEDYVREVTDVVENNLKRIKESLNELF